MAENQNAVECGRSLSADKQQYSLSAARHRAETPASTIVIDLEDFIEVDSTENEDLIRSLPGAICRTRTSSKLKKFTQSKSNLLGKRVQRCTPDDISPSQPLAIEEQARYERLISQKQLETSSIRTAWRDESENLKRENKRMRESMDDLLQKIRLLQEALMKKGAVGDPWQYEFYVKNKAIYELEKKITSMQNQMRFFTNDSSTNEALSIDIAPMIATTMELLEVETGSILHGHDTSIPLHVPNTIQSSDLTALIRSVHTTEGSENEQSLLRHWVLQSAPEMVITVLVLAALREWVFMSSFPSFTGEKNHLLHAYRRTLLSQDGWRNVHNLEVTVYCSLVEDDDMQHVTIPAKAEEYATRLSSALALLFPKDERSGSRHDHTTLFETWGQTKTVCEVRRHRLTAIFHAALRLKAKSVVTSFDYEFLVYPPYTLLNGEERNEGQDIWLHASLYTYARQGTGRRGEMADALLRPKNFIKTFFNDRERVEKSLSTGYISTTTEHFSQSPTPSMSYQSISSTLSDMEESSAEEETVHDSEDNGNFVPHQMALKRSARPSSNPSSAKKQRRTDLSSGMMLLNPESPQSSGSQLSQAKTQDCDASSLAGSTSSILGTPRTGLPCNICNRICANAKGLKIHISKKHKKVPIMSEEQTVLDNKDMPSITTQKTATECVLEEKDLETAPHHPQCTPFPKDYTGSCARYGKVYQQLDTLEDYMNKGNANQLCMEISC